MCPDAGRVMEKQPCREAGRHTQETDTSEKHSGANFTLPTNSSWKPPNPLHFETDARALSYTLPTEKATPRQLTRTHTQRQPHPVTPETDVPQTPTDHRLKPHQIQHPQDEGHR